MRQDIRFGVLILPISAMIVSLIASLVSEARFLAAAQAANRFILDNFYLLISWVAGTALVILLGIAVSPFGARVIGGAGAARRLTPVRWAAIALCSTIAIGLMFWGVAEPIIHYGAPEPGGTVAPRSAGAARFALASVYMHWTFLPYAVYAFAGVVMALLIRSGEGNLSVSGPLRAVWGDRFPTWLATLIDAVALFALVAGVASSLGTGVLSLAGGIGSLAGWTTTPGLTFVIMATLVAAFMASSISGLHKGITFLSEWNTRAFFVFLLLVVLVFPPTGYIGLLVDAGQGFFASFIDRTLAQDAVGQTPWYRDWTSFYLSNWMAWAPVSAIFLAYIARGYTIRAFILVNFVLPSLFSYIWLSLLGGAAIREDAAGGAISAAVDAGGAEAALYAFVELMPAAEVLVPLFLVMSFLSFVTAADSNTLSIVTLCTRHSNAALERRLKIMWGVLLGLTAWLMITVAGIDGLRILSAVGGLPALLILIAYIAALMRWTGREMAAGRAIPSKAGR